MPLNPTSTPGDRPARKPFALVTRLTLRRKLVLAAAVLIAAFASVLPTITEWWTRERPNYDLIEKDLYLGGRVSQPPPGTKAVLNLCETTDVYGADIYLWKPIPDAAPAPTLAWLRGAVNFVAENRARGYVTYVHCAAGVSRGGMVIVAYEMLEHGWSRDQALEFVHTRRPGVRPNPAFMDLLLEWEADLAKRPVAVPK